MQCLQEETNKQLTENYDAEVARCERLEANRRKLEDTLNQKQEDLDRERKMRIDHEKGRL